MRAVSVPAFGDADVLTVTDMPVPRPGPGEVSVDVAAAAVGLVDVLFRRGDLAEITTLPYVPGIEVAGRVRALGPDVDDLEVGQGVVTLSRPAGGGYAEVALAAREATVPLALPDGRELGAVAAVATVPNVVAALAALRDAARLRPEDRVLVLGATGGLASVFPGVARALGVARVVGVVSDPARVEAARALGYDDVVLTGDLTDAVERYDVVVDPVGGEQRQRGLDLLAPLGRMLVVGNASGAADHLVGANQLWLANAGVVGLNVGGLLAAEPHRAAELVGLAVDLVAQGRFSIPTTVLPLEQAAQAHRLLEDRAVTGKVVLAPHLTAVDDVRAQPGGAPALDRR
jgi:NADPH2:quinone reductase